MKKIIILVLACLFLLCGCDETGAEIETKGAETETTRVSLFGLTDKEIEAIEEIIEKSYVGGPYTIDDVSEIICLGHDKMYVEGEWVDNSQLIEYKVIFNNGETQKISINKIMLED